VPAIADAVHTAGAAGPRADELSAAGNAAVLLFVAFGGPGAGAIGVTEHDGEIDGVAEVEAVLGVRLDVNVTDSDAGVDGKRDAALDPVLEGESLGVAVTQLGVTLAVDVADSDAGGDGEGDAAQETELQAESLVVAVALAVADVTGTGSRPTRRMRWFQLSTISSELSAGLMATPRGAFRATAMASPPSPLYPPTVTPATVEMVPLGHTRRIRLLSWSAMNSDPSAGLTATPVGPRSVATVAGPPSPLNP